MQMYLAIIHISYQQPVGMPDNRLNSIVIELLSDSHNANFLARTTAVFHMHIK